MNLGFFQFEVTFADVQENLNKIESALMQSDFDLVLLPELCTTGCLFLSKQQAIELAEDIPHGKTTQTLIKIAQAKSAYIIAGMLETEAEQLYNSAIIVGPEGFIGKHQKVHLCSSDKTYFSAGTQFNTYEILGKRIGILLCYDIWFDSANKALTGQDIDILFNPSNFCGEDSLETILQQTQKNAVYSVVANRLGMDHDTGTGIQFIGSSRIISPTGEVLAEAGKSQILRTTTIESL